MFSKRLDLRRVDAGVPSSYGPGGSTSADLLEEVLRPLAQLAGGMLIDAAAVALAKLRAQVRSAGGSLRITDAYRSVEQQASARARYDRWHRAGRPRPGEAGWDDGMKAAFVALPGRSFHNAGRAIDVHVEALRFPGVAKSQQLDHLWGIAIPLGWTPVLRAPLEGASESWHFDYLGEWKPVVERRGYEEAAIAATLETGQNEAFPACGTTRHIQGQLHRAGYDCGAIDGVFGAKTEGAIYASGYRGIYSDTGRVIAHLHGLASSDIQRWTV
jgi:hypothetical protein